MVIYTVTKGGDELRYCDSWLHCHFGRASTYKHEHIVMVRYAVYLGKHKLRYCDG